MTFFSARRILPAGIIAVAAAGALVAPGAASASLGTQCSGVAIGGQGSSLQKLAQEVWDPGFNTSADKYACNGTQGSKAKPAVTYNPSGSGAGLRSFGVKPKKPEEVSYAATNAFAGTDEAPNPGALAEIEAHEEKLVPSTIQTIPVLQAAVAVIVHLPTGCTSATSTSNAGRLVLNNSTLEAIWRGTITKWSEITDGGDKFTCTGTAAETEIKHIVRFDSSGTTHIFKKYLNLINTAAFKVTNEGGAETGEKSWGEIAEGIENTSWPTADHVIRPAAKGNGEVVAKVAAEPSSIAYANLADARANANFVPPLGGVKKAMFWTPIQNKGGTTVTYADPANNKDVAALGESNCTSELYTNGEGKPFPPENTSQSWYEVTTKTEEAHYTICGLTFDLAFTAYSSFPGTSIEEATTANNFLRFVEDGKGGQLLIKKHDYEPLVGKVLTEAAAGAAKVGF